MDIKNLAEFRSLLKDLVETGNYDLYLGFMEKGDTVGENFTKSVISKYDESNFSIGIKSDNELINGVIESLSKLFGMSSERLIKIGEDSDWMVHNGFLVTKGASASKLLMRIVPKGSPVGVYDLTVKEEARREDGSIIIYNLDQLNALLEESLSEESGLRLFFDIDGIRREASSTLKFVEFLEGVDKDIVIADANNQRRSILHPRIMRFTESGIKYGDGITPIAVTMYMKRFKKPTASDNDNSTDTGA